MRRADTIARAAVATSRRRQLARLCEALELMVNTPARTPDESTAKESAIWPMLEKIIATIVAGLNAANIFKGKAGG